MPLGDQAIRQYATKTGLTLAVMVVVVVVALVAISRRGRWAAGVTPVAQFADSRVGNRTSASEAPRSADGTRVLSPMYKVLLARSLFAADGSAGGAQSSDAPKGNSATTFSLKGITQEDANYTAYVEDTNSRRMLEVHVGDYLAQGQISEITLHGLNYRIDNKVVEVAIGQGLDGNATVADAGKSDGDTKVQDKHNHAPTEVHVSTLDAGN